MNEDNITSKGVTLNSAGKSMQIEVYEKELKRLNNIINELEKELELNLKFKVIGVKRLKDKLKELKEGK